MTVNDIYLAVRGTFDDRISAGVRRAMSIVASTCQKTGRILGGITSILGTMGQAAGGAMGKTASAIGNVASAIITLGPIGGVVTGLSAGFEMLQNSFLKTAKAAEELAKTSLARGLEKLNAIRERVISGMNRGLAEITTNAERSAKAFDAMASAYLKVSAARDATAKAGGDVALANLRADKQSAVAEAGDDNAAALAAADYDIRIANRKYENAVSESAAKVRAATDAAAFAQRKATDAATLEANLRRELAAAEKDVAFDFIDEKANKAARDRLAKVQDALAQAANDRLTADAAAKAAAETLKQAQLRQAEALANARTEVSAATAAQRKLVAAQQKAAEERLAADRAEAEKRAQDGHRKALRDRETAGRDALAAFNAGLDGARKQADESKAKADEAFARFRNPKAFREADRAERENARAERRFQSGLERLQKRKDWRTADLHGGDEAIRRVALARERAAGDAKRVQDMQKDVSRAAADLDAIRNQLNGIAL